ncbi:hypothetical protein SSBR45G_40830 [Bradyrhizobium sp. SSBR45G]|uniref:lipase family protein n=1 Tax=unclassified Bradyrhizobium TaxID=2631580 RepID=UPI002342B14C|nr:MULTISPECIES: lipase family protein [unclassified Bradyrhizobium]GLH79174.1 hypothetical protein SSBR45G_40830 [Bradyrhizobium sp. SSBR45G]GLH84609.1 hypothetical protein SSBR45R_20690 [Bradyrhizobium sp. SSBR45R]
MSILVERPEADYAAMSFEQLPLAPGFAMPTAHAMAWMSQLAYETRDEAKVRRIAQLWTLDQVEVLHEPALSTLPLANTHGVIARKDGHCIIAFAGTDPADIMNWITDFYLGHLRSDIHQGFCDAAAAVWPQVGGEIRRSMDAGETLVVTGHSLGAAIALATLDRAHQELSLDKAEVYVFGCPRVGRAPFRARYNAAFGGQTYRLVYGDDIGPTVPPSEFGFHHVGRLLTCQRGGRFQAAELSPGVESDDPLADVGVFGGIRLRLLGLLDTARSPSSRQDLLGRLSELLSPSLGDHLPDRYIAASAPPDAAD